MYYVKIHYGLGNQLFQYAFAKSLSIHKGEAVKLDHSFFSSSNYIDGDSPRTYKLDLYDISLKTASDEETLHFRKPGFFRRRINTAVELITPQYSSLYRERSFGFEPHAFSMKRAKYYHGYWQDEAYFKNIRSILLEELTLKTVPPIEYSKKLSELSNCNSVCVHVRRGDYLTSNFAFSTIGVLDVGYYRQAMDLIKKRTNSPIFYIFSDDILWCKENFGNEKNILFIDPTIYGLDHEDLRLMSKCKHHIIANSSFSWWGAWLANKIDQMVVAPANWYKSGQLRNLPPEWTLL